MKISVKVSRIWLGLKGLIPENINNNKENIVDYLNNCLGVVDIHKYCRENYEKYIKDDKYEIYCENCCKEIEINKMYKHKILIPIRSMYLRFDQKSYDELKENKLKGIVCIDCYNKMEEK